MFLWRIILKKKENSMSNKIINEYYRQHLRKISKENIEKYHEEIKKIKKDSTKKENKLNIK